MGSFLVDRLVDRSYPLSESLIKFLRNQIPFVSFYCSPLLESSCFFDFFFFFFFEIVHNDRQTTESEICPQICMKIDSDVE